MLLKIKEGFSEEGNIFLTFQRHLAVRDSSSERPLFYEDLMDVTLELYSVTIYPRRQESIYRDLTFSKWSSLLVCHKSYHIWHASCADQGQPSGGKNATGGKQLC